MFYERHLLILVALVESQIKEELREILSNNDKSKTEIALNAMLYIMRKQMFIDKNKRVDMLLEVKL